jgi:hypothetical protein
VASAGNAIELTVRNFSVEPPGLLIDVDDPVPLIFRLTVFDALWAVSSGTLSLKNRLPEALHSAKKCAATTSRASSTQSFGTSGVSFLIQPNQSFTGARFEC